MLSMPKRIIPKQILSVVIAISCNCKQLESLRDMIYDTTIYLISNSYILYHQNTIQKTPYLDILEGTIDLAFMIPFEFMKTMICKL